MKAKEMMQSSVLTATPGMALALAWRLMEDHRIRHLPVVSDGHLIGLVTDRDIRRMSPSTETLHTQAEINLYLGTTTVAACMTRDVITVSPETDIARVTQKMLDGRFGCLPILAQDQLVGIITEIDLLRGYLAASPATRRIAIRDVMQDMLIIAAPEDLVSTAYQRMKGGHIRHLPIVDETDKLVGVLTDRDVRRAGDFREVTVLDQALTERFGMMTVDSLMTTQVVTVRSDTDLADAAERFLTHKFGCLPVVSEDSTLEGLLTVADLLGLYAKLVDSQLRSPL